MYDFKQNIIFHTKLTRQTPGKRLIVRLSRRSAFGCASNNCPQLDQGGDKSEFLPEAWTSAHRGDCKRTPNELNQDDYMSVHPRRTHGQRSRREETRISSWKSSCFPVLWPRFWYTWGWNKNKDLPSDQANARTFLTSVKYRESREYLFSKEGHTTWPGYPCVNEMPFTQTVGRAVVGKR